MTRQRLFGRLVGMAVMALAAASTAAERPAVDGAVVADAAERGDLAALRQLIQAGADVNAAQPDGTTALHWAVYGDDAVAVTLLVEHGAHVDTRNRYGVPPLSLAATNASPVVVGRLLDAGADPNATLEGGETVLMTAARTGSAGVVDALLAAGADPNARERRDQTALMWAASEGHAEVVRSLVAAGGDPRASVRSGFTPLFFAVREGRIGVVHALIEAGVDVNGTLERVKDGPDRAVNNDSYRPVDDGMSPLLLAIRNGHFELALELVEAGADPNDERTGFRPLHTVTWVRKPDASDRGDPPPVGSGDVTSLEFVQRLVALGADVNGQLAGHTPRPPHTASRLKMEGATAFLMAADRADTALMKQLLALGADPSLPNADGTRPLMVAAGLGTTAPFEEAGTELDSLEAAAFLLDIGADLDAVDHRGDTAMHGAAYAHYPRLVHFLAERGADPAVWSRTNERGLTPLFIAEGYRSGGFKPSRPTMDAVTELMGLEGLSMEGSRPKIRDIYERPPETTQP